MFMQEQIKDIIITHLAGTTGYPEVPAGELESGKVIDPWNPKRTHNVRWVSPARLGVPLSCPAAGRTRGEETAARLYELPTTPSHPKSLALSLNQTA